MSTPGRAAVKDRGHDDAHQLQHDGLDFRWAERLAHALHERLEVVLDKLHDDKDLVDVVAHDNLEHVDNVAVVRHHQRVDLAQRRDRKALLFVCVSVRTRQEGRVRKQEAWGANVGTGRGEGTTERGDGQG